MATNKQDIALILTFDDKGTPKVRRASKSVGQELKKLEAKTKHTTSGFKRMEDQVTRTTTSTGKARGSFKTMAASMAAGMGVMMGVSGAMRLISSAIKSTAQVGLEFQKQWANVTTMLSISEGETAKLRTQLINLSPTLGSTTELAKGMYQVLSASIDPAKAIEFLAVAAKSAQAGVTSAAVSVDALTTVINAYGMSADDATKVSDIMFQTVKRGKLTYDSMAGALGTVVPMAAKIGLEFEEVAAAMATLTRQGIDVNTTTVQLRQIMVSVLKPTSEAKKMAKSLGLEFNSAALKTKGLSKFLLDVQEKTKGSADKMTMLFGNVRALTGVMGLAGAAAAEFAGDVDLMKNSAGSTEIAFAKQMKSMSFRLETFKNTVEKAKISFTAGFSQALMEGVTSSENLSDKVKKLTKNTGSFGYALGVMAKQAISVAKTGLTVLTKGITGVSETMTDFYIKNFTNLRTAQEELAAAQMRVLRDVETGRKIYNSAKGAVNSFTSGIGKLLGKLNKLKKTTEDAGTTNIELLKIFEELGIKTKTRLGIELEVLLDKFNAVKSSGLATGKTLEAFAKKIVTAAEAAGKELSPEMYLLAGAMDKFGDTTLKAAKDAEALIIAMPEAANKVRALKIETDKTSKLITGVFAPAVYYAIQNIQIMTSTTEDIIFKMKQFAAQMGITAEKFGVATWNMISDILALSNIHVPKMSKEIVKPAGVIEKRYAKAAATVATTFTVLSDSLEGNAKALVQTLASIFDSIAQSIASGANFKKIFEDIGPALAGQLGGAIGQSIGGHEKSFAGAGSALGGALGATLGSIIPGLGTVLGGVLGSTTGGLLGGLFGKGEKKTIEQKLAEEQKMMIKDVTRVMSEYGTISADTAAKIAASSKKMSGFTAVSKHFASVIADVGVNQNNVNKLWARAGDIMHHMKEGSLDTASGISALSDSFELLVAGAQKLGTEGSPAMIDFIRRTREMGLEVPAVSKYVRDQLMRIPEALKTLVKNAGISSDKLANLTSTTFQAMIAEGMSYMDAIQVLKDPLTMLIEKYEKMGKEIPAFLKPMKDLINLMETEPKIFENLDAAITILKSLQNTAYLTQQTFDTLVSSVGAFARALLNVDGNLNDAMKTMTLGQDQIQALLPIISQFVGAAAVFGLQIPTWMKTFVTEQLGVDWEKFRETMKAQASAAVTTVEKLTRMIDQGVVRNNLIKNSSVILGNKLIDEGFGPLRQGLNAVVSAIREIDLTPIGTGAQHGYHGVVTGPRGFQIEPGRQERVDIEPARGSAGGGVTSMGSPQQIVLKLDATYDNVLEKMVLKLVEKNTDNEILVINPRAIRGQ